MRKLLQLILIGFLASFFITAVIFVSTLEQRPEDIALQYYKAVLEQNPDKVFELLSSKDKKTFPKERLKQIFMMSENALVKTLGSEITGRIKYKIIGRNRNDMTATINLELEMQIPDLRGSIEDLLKILFSKSDEKNIKKELNKKIKAQFKKNKIPYITVKKQVTLVKEKNQWKISIGSFNSK